MAFDPEDLDQPAPGDGLFAAPGRDGRRPPAPPGTKRRPAKERKDPKDSDGDDVSDRREKELGSSVHNPDTDGDGLRDGIELRLGTHLRKPDTDGDGVDDGYEVAYGVTSPRVREPDGQRDVQARSGDYRDPTGIEKKLGVRRNADTDDDGFADWIEVLRATDHKTVDLAPDNITSNLSNIDRFLGAAEAQVGNRYTPGAKGDPDDYDGPDAIGAPELVQWAGRQAGLKTMPGDAWQQYQHVAAGGGAVDLSTALATKGALVFGFTSDPAAGTPARTFVAISLGNGKVIDVARNGTFQEINPGHIFTHGAVIPRLHRPKGDLDGDGQEDYEELVMKGDPSRGGSSISSGEFDLDGDGIPYDKDPDENEMLRAPRMTTPRSRSAVEHDQDDVDPVTGAPTSGAGPEDVASLAANDPAPTTPDDGYPEPGSPALTTPDDGYPPPDESHPLPPTEDRYATAEPAYTDAYDDAEPTYSDDLGDDTYGDDTYA